MSPTAAQATGAAPIVVWSIALMIAAIVGFWFVLWLRKRLTSDSVESGEGLTLGGLRDMHERGEIDDEEFEAAKAAVLARVGGNPGSGQSARQAPGFKRIADPGRDLAGDPLPKPHDPTPEGPDSEDGAN